MSWNPGTPRVALPDELSDRCVAELVELLYAVAAEFERHYAGQLHRYYHPEPDDERQVSLWDDGDDGQPPF